MFTGTYIADPEVVSTAIIGPSCSTSSPATHTITINNPPGKPPVFPLPAPELDLTAAFQALLFPRQLNKIGWLASGGRIMEAACYIIHTRLVEERPSCLSTDWLLLSSVPYIPVLGNNASLHRCFPPRSRCSSYFSDFMLALECNCPVLGQCVSLHKLIVSSTYGNESSYEQHPYESS